MQRVRVGLGLGVITLLLGSWFAGWIGPSPRALAVELLSSDWGVSAAPAGQALDGLFDGPDADRQKVAVRLQPVLLGASQPTDIQFPPGLPGVMVVLEKEGRLRVARKDPEGGWAWGEQALSLDVLTPSEQGLLGLAFAPDFARSGHLFLNHSVSSKGSDVSRISRFRVADAAAVPWTLGEELVILEVVQPYANHDAGQLAFGPDGMLYVGFGDGGWRDDPHFNGQDGNTFLGSMLRLDVSKSAPGRPYEVPADNPFLGQRGVKPELFAMGLRNPWRYSFDPKGRLIVADVGQNTWEEVDIVAAGDNLGWNLREGRHCFPASVQRCPETEAEGFVEPIYEYPHGEGNSITGGYVSGGVGVPALKGDYVFADFATGRFWAIPLPEAVVPGAPLVTARALGRFPVMPSTFGRDAEGRLYVADFGKGGIYALMQP